MMQPLIAVLTPNILTGIGLKAILEKVIPVAEVELYSSVEALGEASPERSRTALWPCNSIAAIGSSSQRWGDGSSCSGAASRTKRSPECTA